MEEPIIQDTETVGSLLLKQTEMEIILGAELLYQDADKIQGLTLVDVPFFDTSRVH